MNFVRKLSKRYRKKTPTYESDVIIEPSPVRPLFRLLGSNEREEVLSPLPLCAIFQVIDELTFFEQIHLISLSGDIEAYLTNKYKHIKRMRVIKQNLDTATKVGDGWQRHYKAFVAVRFVRDTVEIVIDSSWTVADLNAMSKAMDLFHSWIEFIELDAPVAEAYLVHLSKLDLYEWFSFQSYLKISGAYNDRVNLYCEASRELTNYWPKVKEVTLYTVVELSHHLGRLYNYGIDGRWFMSRESLEKITLVVINYKGGHKHLPMNMNAYRCWFGSAGFSWRYSTEYVEDKDPTSRWNNIFTF
ncbi:unnamed protein product [Caenorhabditis auriculariae]|uniref:Uncharacterized protein n=1 Tax=Caenorhabditis auriculariae TaxID=2777116 RepID=A0A8S1GPJ9_9PELO|nr:unnamed protein product [Caenorhabditis auriculariae]